MKCKLYALGSNGCGQLGVGHLDDLDEPQVCLFTTPSGEKTQNNEMESVPYLPDDGNDGGDVVKKVVAGGNHTIILTRKGRVYAAGNNGDGRCGVATHGESLVVFTRVEWAEGRVVTDVAATWEATVFVEDARLVWTCGSGLKGELGLGKDVTRSTMPSKVFDVGKTGFEECRIRSVSSSMGHTIMLLSNGMVYGWGSSRKGQLGATFQAQRVLWNPRQLEAPMSLAISHVATGRDFTILANSDGHHLPLGDFNCGSDQLQLSRSSGKGAQCSAGWSTVYQVVNGQVNGFGQGRRGQLPSTNLPPVASLAAGSEHCVALLTDGNVVAWGWGEHGNCGKPLDDRASVVNRFNTILNLNREVETTVGVGAGCASTFIWSVSDEHPR